MENTRVNKYEMIKADLLSEIKSGILKPDQKILSEKQLCEKYNVSRITATRALADLVSEGFLYRIQGKGTFVKGQEFSVKGFKLEGFSKRIKEKNLELNTKLIEISIQSAPEKMKSVFSLPENKQVILLKRLRIVEGSPLCLSISYLNPEIFYWTTIENMENESLYDLLENKYGFKLGKAQQEFKIGYLNRENAKHLKITEKDPCLQVTLYSYLDDGRCAQYEENYYLGNKYAYHLSLSSPKSEDSF